MEKPEISGNTEQHINYDFIQNKNNKHKWY